jgi:calcineurin-like phosphoesterase family protein
MGAIFKLGHANIMAYVTSRSFGPPRVPRQDLAEFLEMLAYQAQEYLIPERGFEPWPEQIAAVARESLGRLREMPGPQDLPMVPPPAVGRLLENLRSEFADYPLYALAVGADERLRAVARSLATAPMYGQLLVLIPEHGTNERNLEVLDPVPAFSGALHSAPDWPGFQFWTQTGASAFARLDEADKLVRRLRDVMRNGRGARPFPPFPSNSGFEYVLREWSRQTARRYRRLLHLSDLHFGTTDASENQALLDAELREVVQSVDRVVITGDLFNTPKKNYATLFTNFKNNITHLAGGREPISITGNHDQRMIGLFGEDYKQAALIGSRKIVVDDQCEMVFVCFNSSESGRLARGRITKSQFRQLGGDYRTLTAARPELKGYLPIVLVHHHPFSFDVPPETLVQRALAAVGLRDESFLAMVDADDLHRWCLDWNIKTILHGHKHKARYMEREIAKGGSRINLTAIGCGSSLGAEGAPVSYNMLEWDPGTQRWIVSFLESVNGGAFRETVAAVSPHQ